jgi:quercetin dioxygenase-like cupin family protein
MAQTVVRKKGEGKAFWVLGGLYEVRVSSDETDGALTVMEMTIPKGGNPPPHTHPGSETVCVLEGTLRYDIGGQTFECGPGTVISIPKGTWETFELTSDTARVLITYSPSAAIEKFFEEVGEPAQRRELPPPLAAPPDVERIIAVATKYGFEMRRPAQV